MAKPVLGILLGDAAGIGPEIVAKLCVKDRLLSLCRPVVIGDARVMRRGQQIAGVDFPLQIIEDVSTASWQNGIPLLDQRDLNPDSVELGQLSPLSGRVAGDMMVTALGLCRQGVLDGFVYAPLNKAALRAGGHQFADEQHLMAHHLKWNTPYGEMNVLGNLWTSRVTSHIPLAAVSANLSVDSILRAIRLADGTLRRVGIGKPRIAVAALNPHAGESGLCGTEEVDVISPAIEQARQSGVDASGPFPSDTVFINAFNGNYDAVVTMYHDQGQIAMKIMGFQFGVTVASGLPYPITTPAHGTAFDIAGKGLARPDAMEEAVAIAARMADGDAGAAYGR